MLRIFDSIPGRASVPTTPAVGGDHDVRPLCGQPQIVGGLPHARLLEQPSVQNRVDEDLAFGFIAVKSAGLFGSVGDRHRGSEDILGRKYFRSQHAQSIAVHTGTVRHLIHGGVPDLAKPDPVRLHHRGQRNPVACTFRSHVGRRGRVELGVGGDRAEDLPNVRPTAVDDQLERHRCGGVVQLHLSGDRVRKRGREFVGSLVERLRDLCDLLPHHVAVHAGKARFQQPRRHCPPTTNTAEFVVGPR